MNPRKSYIKSKVSHTCFSITTKDKSVPSQRRRDSNWFSSSLRINNNQLKNTKHRLLYQTVPSKNLQSLVQQSI
jgi:hypothetical protein